MPLYLPLGWPRDNPTFHPGEERRRREPDLVTSRDSSPEAEAEILESAFHSSANSFIMVLRGYNNKRV